MNSLHKVLLTATALVAVIFLTVYANAYNFTDMKPASPKTTCTPSVDALLDLGTGFYDGCVAAGKDEKKCEELMNKYIERVK